MSNDDDFEIEIFSSEKINSILSPALPEPAIGVDPLQAEKNNFDVQLAIVNAHIPRIANAIKIRWGLPEFMPYMTSILYSDRPERAGFQSAMLTAMFNLLTIHRRNFHPEGQEIDKVTGLPSSDIGWS